MVSAPARPRVGVIGLGHMGLPMAQRLSQAGFDLIVFNRTAARSARLVGPRIRVASTPDQVAEDAEVVLTCLADVPASRQMWLGDGGLAAGARPGQLLIDHGTVDPETSRECFRAAESQGAHFLDAPVSGGPEGAEAGTLTVMVGGDRSAFDRARPIFQAVGRHVVHMGGAGAGTAAKLVNQLLVGVHTLASCEALWLAERAGLDLKQVAEVLSGAWGASRMLARNVPYIRERRFGPSGAPLRNLHKDFDLIEQWMGRSGVQLPAAVAVGRLLGDAARSGMSNDDLTALYRLIGPVASSGDATDPPVGTPASDAPDPAETA